MADMMKSMPPEQMQEMARMAEQVQRGGTAGGSAPPVDPSMAADMIKNMTPEQMAGMAQAAKDSGMLPADVNFDADMIKARRCSALDLFPCSASLLLCRACKTSPGICRPLRDSAWHQLSPAAPKFGASGSNPGAA